MLGGEPLLDPLLKYHSSGGFKLNHQIDVGNLLFNMVIASIVIGIIVCFLYWRRRKNIKPGTEQPAMSKSKANSNKTGEPNWLLEGH